MLLLSPCLSPFCSRAGIPARREGPIAVLLPERGQGHSRAEVAQDTLSLQEMSGEGWREWEMNFRIEEEDRPKVWMISRRAGF